VIYDSATGERLGRFAPPALAMSLAFHPDGTLLAAGLANSSIVLWDLASRSSPGTLPGAVEHVGAYPLAFTPQGDLLVSGFGNGFQLQVWHWPTPLLLSTIDRVIGIGISPDSGSLVTLHLANEPDAIRVYELPEAETFFEIPLAGQYAPTEFSFNAHNGWMSSVEFGSNSYIANFWDPESAALQASLDFNQDFDEIGVLYDLNSGGFTPGGYFLMTRTGQLKAPEAQPDATGLSETLWACGFALADLEANRIYFSPPMLYDACAGPEYMFDMGLSELAAQILSPDGRFIAADDGFGNLRVWGVDASQPALAPECSGDC
jgi:WD40 repeat protein